MYEEYYEFTGSPFRLTPDQKFWFGSEGHRKAMSYLKLGLNQGEGFIVITGDAGTGKSTIIAQLFAELDETQVIAAQIGTTQVDPETALTIICDSFQVDYGEARGKAAILGAFESFLVEANQQGYRVLLVVDEAQNLPLRTLEELRMLSNLSLDGQPLFQIFLLGQPQFIRTISHPDLAQVLQRVTASYRLLPLSQEEMQTYILHRLEVVGWRKKPTIADDAFVRIFSATNGVPRRINTLCNRLFLYAATEKASNIDGAMVDLVFKDLLKETMSASRESKPEANGSAVSNQASNQNQAMGGDFVQKFATLEAALSEQTKLVQSHSKIIDDQKAAIKRLLEMTTFIIESLDVAS